METLSNIVIVAQAADQAGHRGGQGGAEHGHGLGRDGGQVTVIFNHIRPAVHSDCWQVHAEAVPRLRLPPGHGGRAALPRHGPRHRLPQQTRRRHPGQGKGTILSSVIISSLYCLQVCLMSRDEQNVLVVSYAELKNCLEQSYGEVLAAATAKPKHHLGLS